MTAPAMTATLVPLMTARYALPSDCPACLPPLLCPHATGQRPPPERTFGCSGAIRLGSWPRTEQRGDRSPRLIGSALCSADSPPDQNREIREIREKDPRSSDLRVHTFAWFAYVAVGIYHVVSS